MIYFEAGYVGELYNLTSPRILWNSIGRRGTVAVSTEAVGYAGVNTVTSTQDDEWKPTAVPATWTLTFTVTEPINAVAIDTHTLGTSGNTIAVQAWTGAAWADILSATPADDEPIAFLFSSRATDRIRLNITGGVVPTIAIIHCSESIEVPRPVYMGAKIPIDMALNTQYDTNITTSGRYKGRSILYAKNDNSFQIQHLTEYWVRNTLLPFIKDAREFPYFLLERPFAVPTALSYRWRDADITPERMGIADLMQVSL